jgi:hypothetical protein
MAGAEGILVRKKNEFRVVLSLDLIMQSVALEVDVDDLEPAPPVSDNCTIQLPAYARMRDSAGSLYA